MAISIFVWKKYPLSRNCLCRFVFQHRIGKILFPLFIWQCLFFNNFFWSTVRGKVKIYLNWHINRFLLWNNCMYIYYIFASLDTIRSIIFFKKITTSWYLLCIKVCAQYAPPKGRVNKEKPGTCPVSDVITTCECNLDLITCNGDYQCPGCKQAIFVKLTC